VKALAALLAAFALIAHNFDLGTAGLLYRKPQTYAQFSPRSWRCSATEAIETVAAEHRAQLRSSRTPLLLGAVAAGAVVLATGLLLYRRSRA
jgi:hypothetical protein